MQVDFTCGNCKPSKLRAIPRNWIPIKTLILMEECPALTLYKILVDWLLVFYPSSSQNTLSLSKSNIDIIGPIRIEW